jgi:hypothetical protein
MRVHEFGAIPEEPSRPGEPCLLHRQPRLAPISQLQDEVFSLTKQYLKKN